MVKGTTRQFGNTYNTLQCKKCEESTIISEFSPADYAFPTILGALYLSNWTVLGKYERKWILFSESLSFRVFPRAEHFPSVKIRCLLADGRTHVLFRECADVKYKYGGGGRSGRVWMEHGEWEILFVKCHNMYFSDRVTFFRLKSYIRMVGRSPEKCFKDAEYEWLIAGLTLKSFLQANNRISRNRDTP